MPVVTGPPRSGADAPAPSVVTIGVFDGVHQGHRHLLREGHAYADRMGLPLTALTFDPHPMRVVRPEVAPPMLSTLQHRIELLGAAGADAVRVVAFDADLAALSAEDFLAEYVLGDLAAAAVVTGANFRFGHRASGDAELLSRAAERDGFGYLSVALHGDVSEAWSSSRIRGLVAAGDVSTAAEGLTRWHRVEGPVVRGAGRGRELGYPTANVDVAPEVCRPADGVYAGNLVVDPYGRSQTLPAAISVGANVTFAEDEHHVEAYVLTPGERDLYDQHVAVDFVARIRDMAAFDSVAALTDAMAADVTAARVITGAGPGPTG